MHETPPEPSDWHQVVVTVAADEAERAADLLWCHGVEGVEERAAAGDDDLTLVGGFADHAAAEAAATALTAAGWAPSAPRPVTEDGLDAWRAHAEAVDAPPFLLVPAWLPLPDDVGDRTVLHLDPGRAFGSGSHPTTRLVLGVVGRTVVGGERVLDVGCGSGVLAVAAARLGAASVVGTDIDPAAVSATDENARRAGVADRVSATDAPLGEIVARAPGAHDLVLANLLAPVIVTLGADLVRAVAPGGTLVASGLLADRWKAVLPALAPLEVVEVVEEAGWVAVVPRAPGR